MLASDGWVIGTPVPFSVAIRTSSYPSDSSSRTITRSPRALGRFLPTWSARIGSSRCPRSTSTASRTVRVGRGRSSRRARPGPCARRRARRRRGPRPCRRRHREASRCGGDHGSVVAQVVAVHGDVERAERHLDALDLRDPLGDPARRGGRRGWGCRGGRVPRGPCCARGSRGRCGSVPGRCHGRRGRFVHRGGCPSGAVGTDADWAGATSAGPPSPPHRTAR